MIHTVIRFFDSQILVSKNTIFPFQPNWERMYLIAIITFSICGTFNVFGIYVLIKSKPKPNNQRMILTNVTISSLFIVVTYLFHCIKSMIKGTIFAESYSNVELFFACFTTFSYKLFVMYVTLDRLFAIWYNIHYPIYFTSVCIKRVIISIWLSSLASGAICTVAIDILVLKDIDKLLYFVYLYVSFDIAIIINVFISYSYLYWKAKQLYQNTTNISHSESKDNPKFRVPFLLCLSYIFFNVTADVLTQIGLTSSGKESSDIIISSMLVTIADVLYFCGYFSDILIYVIFQREVRHFCIKLCQCDRSVTVNDKCPVATSTSDKKETSI